MPGSGVVDGALIIDTGINNQGIIKDKAQFNSAVQSMRNTVDKVGRDMAKSGKAYADAISKGARGAREATANQAAIQREIEKTEAAIARLTEKQEVQRRKWETARDAAVEKAAEEFEKMNSGLDAMPWEDAEQAAEQFSEDMSQHINDVLEKLGEFEDTAAFRNMSAEIEFLNEKLAGLRVQLEQTQAEEQSGATGAGAGFANIARNAGRASVTLAKMAGGGALKFLKKLADGAKNAFVQLAKMTGRAIVTGLRTIGSLAARAGKALTGLGRSGEKSNNIVGELVKRVLSIGGLIAIAKKVIGAVKQGLDALAQSDGRVRAAVGSLSAALNGLKGSMAAAFAPILTAIAPALTTLINLLATATNYVGMFLAALTGQSYYMAASGISAVGSAASGASGSVRELKRQLAGFDELNILSAGNNGGGGGGGAGAGASVANYTQIPIDSGIAAFVERLRALFANGEYNAIGAVIAEGINGAFDRVAQLVDWNRVGPVVTGYVDALAGIFNGLVDGIDWQGIGRTFASGINTIAYTINHAFDVIDLAGLGKALADGLNGLVESADFSAVGRTLANILTAKLVIVGNALARFDWEQFGPKLAEGFNSFIKRLDDVIGSIDWPGMARRMARGLNNFISHIEWRELGDTIARRAEALVLSLRNVITEIKWGDAATKFATAINAFFRKKSLWVAAGDTIHAAFKGLLDFTKNFIIEFDEGAAARSIKAALGQIKWDELASDFWNTAKIAFKKAGNFLTVLLGEDTTSMNYGQWKNAQYMKSAGKAGDSLAKTLGKKIGEALAAIPWKDIFESVKTTIGDALSGLIEGLFGTKDGVFLVKLTAALGALSLLLPKKFGALGTIISGAVQLMGGALKTALELMITTTTGQITTLIGLFGALGVAVGNLVYNKYLKDFAQNFAQETAPAVAKVVENLNPTKGRRYATTGNALADVTLLARGELPSVDERVYDRANDRRTIEENTQALQANTQGTKLTDEQYVKWGQSLHDMGYSVAEITDALQLNADQTTMLRKAILAQGKKSENAEGYDATKDPFSVWYLGETSSAPAWDFGDTSATVEVNYQPNVPGGSAYKNTGLLRWLQSLFAPGVDTQSRVSLVRRGWDTVADWVKTLLGGNVDKGIGVTRTNWTTVADWIKTLFMGGGVDKGVGVIRSNWTTVADWIKNLFMGGTVEKGVGVIRSAWSTIAAWITGSYMGGAVDKGIGVTRNAWTTIANWITGNYMGSAVTKGVGVTQSGWSTIYSWIVNSLMGGAVTKGVGVTTSGWTTIAAWILASFMGSSVTKGVGVTQSGWSTITAWITAAALFGGAVTKGVGVTQSGWSTIYSWIFNSLMGGAINKGIGVTPYNFTTIASWLLNSYMGGGVDKLVGLERNGWTTVSWWMNDFMGGAVGQLVGLVKDGWTTVDGWASTWMNTLSLQVKLSMTPEAKATIEAVTGIPQAAAGAIITAGGAVRGFAQGGMVRKGAARWWNSIPRYAAGTGRAHGTMFIAGEAGPEIVGHINGRTEILNKSQLAQAMYSAVTSGMLAALRGIEFRIPAMASGSVMPYEVSAQIAKSTADLQGTLDANNEDLIQTIISVASQIVAAVNGLQTQRQGAGVGGLNAQQMINEINRRTQMFSASPLTGL